MTDIEKLIQIANKEIGVTESPANSDNVKYNTEYYSREVYSTAKIKYYWCVVFIWWLFKQSVLSEYFYGGKKTASCSELLRHYQKLGQVVYDNFKPGDLILYNFTDKVVTKNSAPKHIGLCVDYNGKTITTIDGNTGTTSEANGGAVMKRTRDKKYIVCGIRWSKGEVDTVDVKMSVLQQGAKGDQVKTLQILLNANGAKLDVDGSFGYLTMIAVKQYQTRNKLTIDGSVGKQTWTSLLKGED